MQTFQDVASCLLLHFFSRPPLERLADRQECGEAGAGDLARPEVGRGLSSLQNHLCAAPSDQRWQELHPVAPFRNGGPGPVLGLDCTETLDSQTPEPLLKLWAEVCSQLTNTRLPVRLIQRSAKLQVNTLIQGARPPSLEGAPRAAGWEGHI